MLDSIDQYFDYFINQALLSVISCSSSDGREICEFVVINGVDYQRLEIELP